MVMGWVGFSSEIAHVAAHSAHSAHSAHITGATLRTACGRCTLGRGDHVVDAEDHRCCFGGAGDSLCLDLEGLDDT